jgi:hypothetical protein
MSTLRRTVPLLALVVLVSSGCMLTSGQFVATYNLPEPFEVSSLAFAGTSVDLNTISEYKDHKDELKRVEDLALVGNFTNRTDTAAQLEVWMVPDGSLTTLTRQQVQANGTRLWGPLAVAGNSTEKVDWDGSSALFVGRQALIDEVKGDGQFALYVLANSAFSVRVTKGSLIVVVGAAI